MSQKIKGLLTDEQEEINPGSQRNERPIYNYINTIVTGNKRENYQM